MKFLEINLINEDDEIEILSVRYKLKDFIKDLIHKIDELETENEYLKSYVESHNNITKTLDESIEYWKDQSHEWELLCKERRKLNEELSEQILRIKNEGWNKAIENHIKSVEEKYKNEK